RIIESHGDGFTQPQNTVTKAVKVQSTVKEKTSEAVVSVAVSCRTWVIAAETRNAPTKARSAPAAAPGPRSAPNRCGASIISTPTKPTATAAQRNIRTLSPRKIAASATLKSGVMKPI